MPDAAPVFAAMLLEVAAEDIEHKMRGSLGLSKVAHGYLLSQRVTALRARPGFLRSRISASTAMARWFSVTSEWWSIRMQFSRTFCRPRPTLGAPRAPPSALPRDREAFRLRPARPPVFRRVGFRSGISWRGPPFPPAPTSRISSSRCVRPKSTDGSTGIAGARKLVRELYARDHHLIREHAEKVRRLVRAHGAPGGFSPDAALLSEIRWLLLSRPAPLLRAYVEHGVLESVLPELAEADAVVEGTRHHFLRRYLDDVTLALSILYEEREDPRPRRCCPFSSWTWENPRRRTYRSRGGVTYHGHEVAGAALAGEVCRRLGIGEPVTSDVVLIVRNHNALVLPSGRIESGDSPGRWTMP